VIDLSLAQTWDFQIQKRRIAAGPSSLDALIAAQAKKLDTLRPHKKGLMQELFLSLQSATEVNE
jgi:hypothetical protein